MGDVDNIDQNDESGAVFQHSACSGGAQRFGFVEVFWCTRVGDLRALTYD